MRRIWRRGGRDNAIMSLQPVKMTFGSFEAPNAQQLFLRSFYIVSTPDVGESTLILIDVVFQSSM
jgi:hypothetical protein